MKLYISNVDSTIELPSDFKPRFSPYRRRTSFKPRYSKDGSINMADGRIDSFAVTLSYMQTSGNPAAGAGQTIDQTKDAAYKDFVSQLLGFFRPENAPFYLIDTDTNTANGGARAEIEYIEHSNENEDGLIYRVGNNHLTLQMLQGHWEDVNINTYSDPSGISNGDDITINNDSELEAYPVFSFLASTNLQSITFTNTTNDQYFIYANTSFGAGSTLVIDGSGEEARVELDGVETGYALANGSGMIVLEPGSNNLLFESPGGIVVPTVQWRRRFAI